MKSTPPFEAIRAHLPLRLAERVSTSEQRHIPDERWTTGIALFADVSGFSALCEQLAQEKGGPERITEVLNRCLGTLTDTIIEWGGDVVSFSGDAILALWDLREEEGASLGSVVGCVQSVRRQLDGFEPLAGIPLRLRFGVGLGPIWEPIVGNPSERCYYLAAGEAVRQATAAQAVAKSGQIVLSREAAYPELGKLTAHPDGFFALERAKPPTDLPKPSPPILDPRPENMTAFVPDLVLEALRSDHIEWMAELRQLTIGFVHLEGFGIEEGTGLATLQSAISDAEGIVRRYRGSIPKLLFDDKGLTILMAWGTAGHAHEDNATRALRASLEIHERVAGTRIGLATGQAFVGALGSETRREYTMVGNAINRASRVMESAEDEVLCDGATRSAAMSDLSFSAKGLTPMRGFKDPVALYRPLGIRSAGSTATAPMVGRSGERRKVAELVRHVAAGASKRCVVSLSGEAGLGKSRFVESIATSASAEPVRVLTLDGSHFDRASPYYAWTALFCDLLSIDTGSSPSSASRAVTQWIDEHDLPSVPLIVEALGFAGKDESSRGDPDAIRRALARLLARLVGDAPLLLVLDDAQWMDSASLALAETAFHQLGPMVLLAASRPVESDEQPPEWEQFLHEHATAHITLRPLEHDDSVALACQLLDVDFLPSAVARVVREKAEGHPLFTEELVRSLIERELISVNREERLVEFDRRSLADFSPPDTLQGIVAWRLDRLSMEDVFTLKVASILGREFEVAAVGAIHPKKPPMRDLERALDRMVQYGLLETSGSVGQFRHAVFADVTYNLIPLTMRQQLHSAAALHFERSAGGEGNVFKLAQHWRLADDPHRGVDALETAGDRSIELGSFRESADYYADAFAMGTPHLDAVRLARLKRKQGVSLRSMGDLTGSHSALIVGLTELGRPMPTGMKRLLGIGWATTVQILHRSWLRPFLVPANSTKSARVLELAELYFALGSTTFQSLDATGLFYVGISALNHAERVAPSGVLALSESFLMYVTGVLGMRRAAAQYFKRALQVSERIADHRVQAEVLYNSAGLRGTLGEWAKAESDNNSALALYIEAADQKGQRTVQTLLAYHAHLRGDLVEERRRYEAVLDEARAHEDATAATFATLQLAEVHLRGGEPALALASTQTLRPADVESAGGRGAILKLVGVRALASLRLQDAAASVHADRFLEIISASQPFTAPNAYDGHLLMARYFIEAKDVGRLEVAAKELAKLARGLRVARPAASWTNGHVAFLKGSPRKAEKLWKKGLGLSQKMGLPFEEMLMRKDLAWFATGDERQAALSEAITLASSTGAVVEYEGLVRMLRRPSA